MRNFTLEIMQTSELVTFTGRQFRLVFSRVRGKWTELHLRNGREWVSALAPGGCIGDDLEMPVLDCQVQKTGDDSALLQVTRQDDFFKVTDQYEIYGSGWVVCNSSWEVLAERALFPQLQVGMLLDEAAVFQHAFRSKFVNNDQDERESIRGMAIDFSVDSRPVTHSLNFLLEKVTMDIDGRPCRKILEQQGDRRFWGWKLSSGWRYPHARGFCYRNRWAFSMSGLDFEPSPVRGQRIYHFYGTSIPYPDEQLIDEMAEYGASILVLHNSWRHISGMYPLSENELKRVVEQCHRKGIKVLPYCTPNLIAQKDPAFSRLSECRTECLNIWVAAKTNQLTNYTPSWEEWDCDELCLRCPEAFDYVLSSMLSCVRQYGLDGLYMDFAWPAQGLCNDERHGHDRGLFNFYDYFRLTRALRQGLGGDKIMIGHGGGFIIATDMLEGFDACLTGEAQVKMNPETLGCQFGCAPTLWTIQRSKGEIFRSARTIEESVREGVTIHYGVGIGGKAVIATMDPAHHRELLALWQMYRAFPVESARFYNYLHPTPAVELDNPEVFYSLYANDKGQALLLLANAGGEMANAFPCVGVNVQLRTGDIGLSDSLQCVPLRGSDYQTFRIGEPFIVEKGSLNVPEIALHEFLGFVLFEAGNPPQELFELGKHLDTRWDRLPGLLAAKQKRLHQQDALLLQFSKDPLAGSNISYEEFTRGRSAE